MAAAHNVTNPGTKRVTSLKTEGVKALKFSSDANRNRVAFDLWNATFRAAIGDHYSRLLDERPPTFITFAADYPGHSEESVAASYVHAQEVWREDSQLVCNAITRTCNFEDDPSGQLLDDLLNYETNIKQRPSLVQIALGLNRKENREPPAKPAAVTTAGLGVG